MFAMPLPEITERLRQIRRERLGLLGRSREPKFLELFGC